MPAEGAKPSYETARIGETSTPLPRLGINRSNVGSLYIVQLFPVRRRLCETDFSQPKRSIPCSIADPLWTLSRREPSAQPA